MYTVLDQHSRKFLVPTLSSIPFPVPIDNQSQCSSYRCQNVSIILQTGGWSDALCMSKVVKEAFLHLLSRNTLPVVKKSG